VVVVAIMMMMMMMIIIIIIITISKSLRQYLGNASGKHEIKELQKNSHIGHCTHTAASANVKIQNIFHRRNNITCSKHCTYRTAATLYTLATRFVSAM
jgi:biopolymer transport protein ExbB/TolQ